MSLHSSANMGSRLSAQETCSPTSVASKLRQVRIRGLNLLQKQIFGNSWEFGLWRGGSFGRLVISLLFFWFKYNFLTQVVWSYVPPTWCDSSGTEAEILSQIRRYQKNAAAKSNAGPEQGDGDDFEVRELGSRTESTARTPEELAQIPIIPNIKSKYYSGFRLASQIFHIYWTSNINLKHSRYCEQCDVAFNHI